MKKRIISLILVVVMVALALASCSFNYAGEDLTKYGSVNESALKAALSTITIEDGDFSYGDAEKRTNMVLDAIYKALAGLAETDDKLVGKTDDPETEEDESEEAIGIHDLVYYCYYVTATVDGTEYVFLTENMDTDKAASVQLGKLVFTDDDELAKLVTESLESFTFSEDTVYESVESGTIEDGQWVFVSYDLTKDTLSADGATTGTYSYTAKNDRVQVSADDRFTSQLAGKTIGSKEITLTNASYTVDEDGDGVDDVKYTYDNVKVTYAEKMGVSEIPTFEYVLYPTEDNKDGKKVTPTYYNNNDSAKKEIDLAGVTLTYHVYPTSYVKVPEYSAITLLNDIYGSKLAIATMAQLIFGDRYIDATEAEDSEAALKALYAEYKFTSDGDSDVTLDEFVTIVADLQKALETAETALDKAQDSYDKAFKALNDAIEALDKAIKADEDAKKDVTDTDTENKAAANALEGLKADADKYSVYEALKAEYERLSADETAKSAYDAAKLVVDGKTTALSEAQKAYDAAMAEGSEATEEEKTAATDALNAAKAALKEANDALAATDIAKAKAAYDADEVKKAVDAADTAAKAYEKAVTDAETAAKKLEEAKKKVTSEKDDFVVEREKLYGTPDYILTPADDNYDALLEAYETAKAALEAEVEAGTVTDATKQAFIDARVAFSEAVEEGKENPASTDPVPGDEKFDVGAQGEYDEALAARDADVAQFIEVVGEDTLTFGYEYNITYKTLEDEYNLEIKQAIAKIVYNDIIKANVTVTSVPDSVVNQIYDELIDNFQIFFYENIDVEKETSRGDSEDSYFDKYDGSFRRFMTEYAVSTAFGVTAPESYDEALALVKERATAIAKERMGVYLVAQHLGVKLTDKQFEAYVEEKGYAYYEDSVLESIRLGRQLEIVLDTLLGGKEITTEVADGEYAATYVDYTKLENGEANPYISAIVKTDAE